MAHIILIEPDRLLAGTYREALTARGHRVVPCASAQAGVLAADQQSPDLVILELQLIGHSGIEFLYEFRSYPEWATVPIIVQSHVPPAEFEASGDLLTSQLGIMDYLYKPATSLDTLLRTVRQNLTLNV